VVERGFAWATRFRRLARNDERVAATRAALQFLAFVCLLLHRFTALTLSPKQPLARQAQVQEALQYLEKAADLGDEVARECAVKIRMMLGYR
jgi:hypothetical protein